MTKGFKGFNHEVSLLLNELHCTVSAYTADQISRFAAQTQIKMKSDLQKFVLDPLNISHNPMTKSSITFIYIIQNIVRYISSSADSVCPVVNELNAATLFITLSIKLLIIFSFKETVQAKIKRAFFFPFGFMYLDHFDLSRFVLKMFCMLSLLI